MQTARRSWLTLLGPGILVAATGVGAGDLLTASLGGSKVGITLVVAAALGALLKWTLNEGVARWQMATDTTLLEGWSSRLGAWIRWIFLLYFLLWSFFVGGALINACGIAGDALWRLGDARTSQMIWGVVHSLLGVALVWIGGFKLLQWLMSGCIAIMFAGVLVTAVLLPHDWAGLAKGFSTPTLRGDELPWTLAVLGGVGGTVTLLSYGYWIREAGRSGASGLADCRIDLTVAYVATALFGMAMILIGTRIEVQGGGLDVALKLAEQLGHVLGPAGQWLFLVGFWGAVFSSLLGVWQSAPYLFADFLALSRGNKPNVELAATIPYRAYLVAIAVVPLPLLWLKVAKVQLAYAVMGALFMPLLALTLLLLNNRRDWVGVRFANGWLINGLLVATLLLFAALGILQLVEYVPKTGA